MKKAKNGKVKNGSLKKIKKPHGEAVKGTCIEHKMLGGSEDEMYASEDDLVDVSDMFEDVEVKGEEKNEDCGAVPMANASKFHYAVGTGEIKLENDDPLSIPKKVSKKKKNLNTRRKLDDDNDGEEKVVEWSTGRGSSRLVQNDGSDEEAEPIKGKKEVRKVFTHVS
ncbi:hypothetical protein TELCIR_21540 [Teladorsagia circumcincta]|uniref:Uncharacterized protein n=1 Tax=Teladorsagia circumcincta TaxID=45464 RepID=A0A2G9TGH1_TELCI|nr:hypothetical protein TELCIR_21540 [Teladorsagia circumcincta]